MQLACKCHMPVFYSEMFSTSSDGPWWVLFPITVLDLGLFLSLITLFEFVFAQTPHSIRGLMTGLIVLSIALSSSIGYGVCKLAFALFPNLNTWFISNVSVAFACAVYLILFVCFSKHYNVRKRDGIVPIHLFAEEYFEKELEGRRRLESERLQWENNFHIE